MHAPEIVSREDWDAARQQLLVKEKELTRARDALAAERRRMPWLAVDEEYAFETPGISIGYWKARKRPARERSSGSISRRFSPSRSTSPSVTS